MYQNKYKVTSNEQLLNFPGGKYFLMRIAAPEIAGLCRPGQFIMIKCGEDLILRRPFSIHDKSETGEIHVLYAVMDKAFTRSLKRKGTDLLSNIEKGTELDILGPCGNGFDISKEAQTLLLVGGGIGIAPLVFLAKEAILLHKSVIMLIGGRTRSALIPSSLLPSDIELFYTTEDGTFGKKALLTEIVNEFSTRADQIFSCGPIQMYRELQKVINTGIPTQVSLEIRMGCGTGACYACSIPTTCGMKRVCKEGPIFNIKDIIWEEVKL